MNRSLVDTHVHLWDPEYLPYTWLEAFPTIHETHDLDDYDAAVGETTVESLVFVECTESFDDLTSRNEVRWVQSLARDDDRIQGIVAHASLEKGAAARSHLDWLAQRPLVKGVRRILQDEPDDFCLRPDFVEGVRTLPDYGFTFDLTVRAPQLANVVQLVDRCPGVDFVLDHIGKPNIQGGRMDPWREQLAALADRPNVACKISGVLTEADPEDWTVDTVRPYVEHALVCFGIDRVLFGGDWPVVRLAADYTTWLDVLEACVQSCSEVEQQKLFRDNAERIYRLS